MKLSSQRMVAASDVELKRERKQECVKLVKEIRRLFRSGSLRPPQLYAVDKMYVKDKPTYASQVAPIGLYAFFILLPLLSSLLL